MPARRPRTVSCRPPLRTVSVEHDPDVVDAETQFRIQSCLSNLCDARVGTHTRWTLWWSEPPRRSNLPRVASGPWSWRLAGRRTRLASPRLGRRPHLYRLRTLCLLRSASSLPMCQRPQPRTQCDGHVFDVFFREPACSPTPPGVGWPPTASQPWEGHEACDFASTSCLRPATRKPGQSTTQNLAKYENPKRTFHDTANRCHQNGLQFTQRFSDSARKLVTWISHWLSTTSLRTPSDIKLELAQRISPSLHRDSARAMLRRVRLVASRDAQMPLGPDDWWPAWDDPDSDAWSSECDSLPEMSDDECLTTDIDVIGPSGLAPPIPPSTGER